MKVRIFVAIISIYIIIQHVGRVQSKGNTTKLTIECRLRHSLIRNMLRNPLLSPESRQTLTEHLNKCPYSYTNRDTGNSTLGKYLARTLGKIGEPTSHDGISYHHYTVQHYYHSKDLMPETVTIEHTSPVPCEGGLRTFCPSNTQSLCMNNGTAMCLGGDSSTFNCTEEKDKQCVEGFVSCIYHNNPKQCRLSRRHAASIIMPCMTTIIMERNTYINETIRDPIDPEYFYSEPDEDSPEDNLARFCLAIRIDPTA